MRNKKFKNLVKTLQRKDLSKEERERTLGELRDLPRGKNHPLECRCEVCFGLRTERRTLYAIKIREDLKQKLRDVGSDTVREYLEKKFG